MRFPVLAGVLACALLPVASLPAAPPAYALQVKPAQRIEAVMVCEVEAPNGIAKDWFVYAALPPDLPSQTRHDGRLTPGGKPALELSSLGRPILSARVPVTSPELQKKVSVEIRYEATLLSRKLVPSDPKAKPAAVTLLTPQERKAALAATPLLDFQKSDFQAWLTDSGLWRHKDEGDIDLARRIYKHLLKICAYQYRNDLDRRSSAVCYSCKSDCGGLSGVLVSALRANDVPARLLVGRVARSDRPGDPPYGQCHVRAEFFAEDVGWVPVDVSYGVTSKFDHFGNDAGDHLVQHVDLDLVVNPAPLGRKNVQVLQHMEYWMYGRGSADGVKTQCSWKVHQLPLEAKPKK
jgi:transglutaminase-like putative cysteine protease